MVSVNKFPLEGTLPSTMAPTLQVVDESPVKLHLSTDALLECIEGQLWVAVPGPDRRKCYDDEFLLPGEKMRASHDMVVWVSSLRAHSSTFKVVQSPSSCLLALARRFGRRLNRLILDGSAQGHGHSRTHFRRDHG